MYTIFNRLFFLFTPMQADLNKVKKFLFKLLSRQISNTGINWLNTVIYDLETNYTESSFMQWYSLVPRFTGTEKLFVSEKDTLDANKIRKGWHITNLTIDQTTRILLVLNAFQGNISEYNKTLNKILSSGDLKEIDALFSALPLLPFPKEQCELALAGKRTNISSLFDRIALNNPFPSEYLDDDNWNQMILKAVFIESPLYKIYGLDKRMNIKLASMLFDYAKERKAAGRVITPELWRLVAPYAESSVLESIKQMFEQELIHKFSAALFCSSCSLPEAKTLIKSYPQLMERIKEEKINWDEIGKKWFHKI